MEIPDPVDLAVVVVPAPLVPQVLEQCGRKGVKGAVVISAGFHEAESDEGRQLEDELRRVARAFDMPVIGPNTFGFVNLVHGVNTSFTHEFSLIRRGGVTLLSQSGGFCHLFGFLAVEERVGMAMIVGLGNRSDLDFPEAVSFFLEDEVTRVLALYIEGMEEPRKLIEVLAGLGRRKPVLVYKAGRNEKGDAASRFYTGSLAGDYRIWKGALRQARVLQVEGSEELLDTVKALDSCGVPHGNRIAVLSAQAGPGIVAADVLEKEGVKLARFSCRTQSVIDELLPPAAIRTNPVDMGPA